MVWFIGYVTNQAIHAEQGPPTAIRRHQSYHHFSPPRPPPPTPTTKSVEEVDLLSEIFPPHPLKGNQTGDTRSIAGAAFSRHRPCVLGCAGRQRCNKSNRCLQQRPTRVCVGYPRSESRQAEEADCAEGGTSHHRTHGPSVLWAPVHDCAGPRGGIEAQR